MAQAQTGTARDSQPLTIEQEAATCTQNGGTEPGVREGVVWVVWARLTEGCVGWWASGRVRQTPWVCVCVAVLHVFLSPPAIIGGQVRT